MKNNTELQVKRGIKFKLLLTTLSLVFSLLITFTAIQIFLQSKVAEEELQWHVMSMKQNLVQQGKSLSKLLAIQVEREIAAFNFSNINELLNYTTHESGDLKYAILTNLQGITYTHTEKPELLQTKLTNKNDIFAIQQQHAIAKEYSDMQVIEYITPINFAKPWGVLRLGFSLKSLQKDAFRSKQYKNRRTDEILIVSIIIAIVFIIIASIIILILANTISKPLISLTKFSQELGKGNFSYAVDAYSIDNKIDIRTEIGLLATAFIQMANEVKDSHHKLENYNLTLEDKVKQRTEELLQSEKMAALGQLITSIAHEVNTPLGAINSSANSMRKFLNNTLTVMPVLFQSFSKHECDEFMRVLNKSLDSDTSGLSAKEQRKKRRALVRELEDEVDDADSIADTLVDMGIYQDIEEILPLLKRDDSDKILDLAYQLSELKRGTQTINMATERAAKVVFALKSYAHQDVDSDKIDSDIRVGLETVLTLYQGQIKYGVDLIKNYATNLPNTYCYPDELNQVWTNLIHNSLQAMDNKGILTINAYQQDNTLKVLIQDSGEGIKPENLSKIFNAFYTTKAAGEGSGLGLHIIKKIIVEKHSGSIDVESEPGKTVFTVTLPILDN